MLEPLESRRLFSAVTPQILGVLAGRSLSNVVEDSSGNVYGSYADTGGGSIFKIPVGGGTPVTLASFGPGDETNTLGVEPASILIDSHGNLFGTTVAGGGASVGGTLWELPTGDSSIKVLERFGSGGDGIDAYGGLVMDSSGNLFGSGSPLYEYPADGSGVKLLGSLSGVTDLVISPQGNLFGIATDTSGKEDYTRIFEVAKGVATPQTIATFSGAAGGQGVGITVDAQENLFITTQFGGTSNQGALIELPAGASTTKVLASLSNPFTTGFISAPVLDSQGNLYAVARNTTPDSQILELPAGASAMQSIATLGNYGTVSIEPIIDGNIAGIEQADIHTTAGSGNVFDIIPPTSVTPPAQPTPFGNVNGHANIRAKMPLTTRGTAVFQLLGPGVGNVMVDPLGGFDLSFSSTTSKTRVLIGVTGRPITPVTITDLYNFGALAQFVAPAVNVQNTFTVAGGLQRMIIHNIANATLDLGTANASLSAAAVVQSAINLSGNLTINLQSGNAASISASNITSAKCQGNFSGGYLSADANIGRVLIGRNLVGSTITAHYTGALSQDMDPTPYVLQSITVLGSISSSTIQASIFDFVDPGFSTGGPTTLTGGKIAAISVRGSVSTDSKFFAYHLPASAVINRRRVKTVGNPLFVT